MSIKEAISKFMNNELAESRELIHQSLGEMAVKKLDEKKQTLGTSLLGEKCDKDEDEDEDEDDDSEDDSEDDDKADKDHDGDGEVESSEDEWKGSRDKAIKKKMKNEENLDEISTKKASAYQEKAMKQSWDTKLSMDKRNKRAKGAIRAQDKMDARFHPLSPARVKTKD